MNKINMQIEIGSKTVRNRITYAPVVKFGWADTSGIPNPRFARHYEERAEGGAGLIVVEASCVSASGRLTPSQLGLWDDVQIGGHSMITRACHRHGTVVLVQLHHGGYNTHRECGPSKGPSAVSWRKVTTEALTHTEIIIIRDQYIDAAERAKKAGYDGVQIHACHGYLINQFLSPAVNLRTDAYGGSTANRTLLACEIISGIHSACGDDFIVSVRTPGAEPTLEEAWSIADAFIDAGADYLQVSGGIGPEETNYPEGLPYNRILWAGSQMHHHINGRVPVSVVNGILDPSLAQYLIEEGLADTIDSARALLADPKWTNAVIAGGEYVKCRNCKACIWFSARQNRCPAVAERHVQDPDCVDYCE